MNCRARSAPPVICSTPPSTSRWRLTSSLGLVASLTCVMAAHESKRRMIGTKLRRVSKRSATDPTWVIPDPLNHRTPPLPSDGLSFRLQDAPDRVGIGQQRQAGPQDVAAGPQ